jgi:ABC-type Fe3+ transport system substrate-binding protein
LLCLNTFAAEKLVIISPHWEGIRYEFSRAFAEWYGQPVEVDWRDLGGASDDLKFVVSEFEKTPAGIGIDLFFGGGSDPFFDLAKRHLLDRYDPPNLAGIPAEIGGMPVYDPDHRWFGVALSGFGILYNKRALAAKSWSVLATWRDLAEKAPVGAVGSGDPRNSGSQHMIYEMILQRYGWDEGWALIYNLAGKVRSFDRSSSTTAKECAVGNTGYALAIDFYALTQIAAAGKENMGFNLPRDCVVINPDSIAILRGAPNRLIAEKFVEFCLSDAGQNLLMVPRGQPGGAQRFSIERMSLRPAMYEKHKGTTLVPINPFAQEISFRYDPKKGGARWGIVNDLIGATIIDVHAELVAAVKQGRTKFSPPISEAEALRLAGKEWKDPSYRQRKVLEWQRWAAEKYRQ